MGCGSYWNVLRRGTKVGWCTECNQTPPSVGSPNEFDAAEVKSHAHPRLSQNTKVRGHAYGAEGGATRALTIRGPLESLSSSEGGRQSRSKGSGAVLIISTGCREAFGASAQPRKSEKFRLRNCHFLMATATSSLGRLS